MVKLNMYKFTVIGHDGFHSEGAYRMAVEINIEAKSAEDAIKRAKKLIKKKDYSIRNISEPHNCKIPDYTEVLTKLFKKIK